MKLLKTTLLVCLYTLLLYIVLDVTLFRKNWHMPRHYEDDVVRQPMPYVEFSGRPNARGHNELGYPGKPITAARPGSLRIVFLGGSTGYGGEPPIPEVLDGLLQEAGIDAEVFNFSVVSSNHRQHLHALVERVMQHEPDIVIFYGGYNETIQTATYDPRPGYPYNYFYRAETPPWARVLFSVSGSVQKLERKYWKLTGLSGLREEYQPYSEDWNRRIIDNYFDTLDLAARITGAIDSKHCGKARFFAFYQPYQVPDEFLDAHDELSERIAALPYGYDMSSSYEHFGTDIYVDIVHVRQPARDWMAKSISGVLLDSFRQGGLSSCH